MNWWRSEAATSGAYTSPLADSIDRSPWTMAVRLDTPLQPIYAWLYQQPDIVLESDKGATHSVLWRTGDVRFRLQLFEVLALTRKEASTWALHRRWKQPHRLLIAIVVSVQEGDPVPGLTAANNALQRIAAAFDGEWRVAGNETRKRLLTNEVQRAQSLPVAAAPTPEQAQPSPLTAAQHAHYEQMLAENLTGEQQAALMAQSPAQFQEWLDLQLRHVPMPSEQKPDINGYREGDRVVLISRFVGETVVFEVGRTAIFLLTNTSPAHVRLAREGLYEVCVEGQDGSIIGLTADYIRKVPGHAEVTYRGDNVVLTPA